MKIESTRFGTLEIEPSKVVEFPRGLPGFEHCHRFSLFHQEGAEPKYVIMHSLDDVDVAFYLADPAHFNFNYEIKLSDVDVADIGLMDPASALVLVMVMKADDNAPLTANLNAPVVINLETQRGLQYVFEQPVCAPAAPSAPESE